MKNVRLAILSIILLACAVYIFYAKILTPSPSSKGLVRKGIVARTYSNYGAQTAAAADKYKLPQEYLLALIALECSGRKIIPHRFEPHVYSKLQKVKNGNLASLEMVTHSGIKNMSDDALKNLSRSWGPYQLMGYKVFEIGVKIEDIRGDDAVLLGTYWIDKNYGKALNEQRFKDAFHIHNTGSPYPKIGPAKTYNKNYVPKGLEYLAKFSEMIKADSLGAL
jgi:hypothetical protein